MKRQRDGFTLIELLVVITIIGMLVGLLLPAIQMAREAARRGVCSSNLKQLTTALTGHSQKLGYFPSGGWGSNCVGIPDLGVGPGQPGGWIYQILPYMDQVTMYEMGRGGNSAKTALMISTPISALYCPSRRAPRLIRSAAPRWDRLPCRWRAAPIMRSTAGKSVFHAVLVPAA